MSPMRVTCPQCRVILQLAANPDGKAVKCPKCGTAFRLALPRAPAAIPLAATALPPTPVSVADIPLATPAPVREAIPVPGPGVSRDQQPASSPARGRRPLVLAAVLGAVVLLGGAALVVALSGRAREKQAAQLPDQPGRPPARETADVAPGAVTGRRPLPADPTPEPDQPAEVPAAGPGDGEKPLLVLDAGGHTAPVKRALFTPDGGRLVTVSLDKTVRLYDVATGESLRVFRLPIGAGEEGALQAGAVSPGGRVVAVSGMPFGRGRLGALIHLVNLNTGRVERVLKGHRNAVSDLAFAPDGQLLASASHDHTVILYDLRTGKVDKVLEGHSAQVWGVAFSPDGRSLATVSEDHTGRIWSVATGAVVAELKGHTGACPAVAWSPDGKTVATAGVEGTIRLWESDGRHRATITFPNKEPVQPSALAFRPDSRELLYTGLGAAGPAGILDVTTGKFRLAFTGHSNTVQHGSLSRDGKLAASTGGNDNETFIWRVEDGAVVHRLATRGRAIWGTGWGADGKSIAWGTDNRYLRGRLPPLARTFNLDELQFGPAPDNVTHRARTEDGRLSLARLDLYRIAVKEGERTVSVLESPVKGDRIQGFTLLDDRRAVMGASTGVYLADLSSGKTLRRFLGHTGEVLSVSPSPDGRHFLTGSLDQTLRIWDPDRDEPLLSLFVADNEWIAWTPDGYYAASPTGERLMGWQINNGVDRLATYHPAARFHKSLYHPEVFRLLPQAGSVEKALALAARGKRQPAAAVNVVQVLPPNVAITAPAGRGVIALAATKVEVKTVARSVGQHPVTALRLLVDGRPYQGQAGLRAVARPALGEVREAWTAELTPGRHVLNVLAESAVSKALSPPVEVDCTVADEGERPNLFILAAGVSAYPGKLRLNYAAADADAITRTLRDKGKRVFGQIEVKLLTDREATKDNIIAGLRWLGSKMTARDVGIVFFSGHGATDPDGNLYLVPVDVEERRPDQTCLPADLLKQALENMPGRLLAVFDACHSGAAAEPDERRDRAATGDLVRDLVSDDYGVVVMASSGGDESSLESSEVRGGFFTRALVEGLSGAADFNRDGVVYIHELDAYALVRVRQLSRGMQTPVTGKPDTIRSFPLSRP
jgi:WD40 repeat protein